MELGISALTPTVGLSGLPDPMGDATAALEARRRAQVEGAGYDPDVGLYDRYSAMLGTVLGPTIAERSRAAADAMRRGDMATYQKLATDLSMDFGSFLGSIKPIRAYHGSPYDFDKFSMDKIGSGEGAQAYGHGLYFAENEGVARSYRDALTRERGATVWRDAAGREVDIYGLSRAADAGDPKAMAATFLQQEKNVDDALNFARRLSADAFDGGEPVRRAILDGLEQFKASGLKREQAGRMYEVNIHADPERFLDWDAPLPTGHPARAVAEEYARVLGLNSSDPQMRNAAKDGLIALSKPEFTGQGAHNVIRDALGKDTSAKEAVSNALHREAGIPGIKYLDQGSRVAGDGSRNYVVFDDKLIEILRKYGIMAPVTGAGIGSLYMGGEEGM